MARKFKVGQRVHFKGSGCNPPRFGIIAKITKNSLGTTIYILRDGGMFSGNELEPAK